ncbi:MAG: hypothetical protein ACRBCJ_03305 [Hyphomicrobiaceae bacterium]
MIHQNLPTDCAGQVVLGFVRSRSFKMAGQGFGPVLGIASQTPDRTGVIDDGIWPAGWPLKSWQKC